MMRLREDDLVKLSLRMRSFISAMPIVLGSSVRCPCWLAPPSARESSQEKVTERWGECFGIARRPAWGRGGLSVEFAASCDKVPAQ